MQGDFFKKLDAFDLHAEEACVVPKADASSPENTSSSTKLPVHSCLSVFSRRRPSNTIVMEAAIHLIKKRLSSGVNWKQLFGIRYSLGDKI